MCRAGRGSSADLDLTYIRGDLAPATGIAGTESEECQADPNFGTEARIDPSTPGLRLEGTRRVWPFLGMIEVRAVKAPDPEIF
jgi:hypothetical protein